MEDLGVAARGRQPAKSVRLPNFLIIGGVRCGTTSLYRSLRRHPQVFMPRLKEPDYLAHRGLEHSGPPRTRGRLPITDLEAYRNLFADAGDLPAVGEASAINLYLAEHAIDGIRTYLPDARMIVQLRQPVERAYSQFRMARMLGREPESEFRAALALEEERVRAGWGVVFHYRRQSFYSDRIRAYFQAFGRDRVRVYLFDDFVRDPLAIVQDIYRYIGVDPAFVPPGVREAAFSSTEPHGLVRRGFRAVETLPRRAIGRNAGHARRPRRTPRLRLPPTGRLEPEVRAELTAVYREDVLRLQELLGRDLTHWLG